MPYKDPTSPAARASQRKAAKKFRLKDPARWKAITKAHYDRHREKILARCMKKHWGNRDVALVKIWKSQIKRKYGITVAQYEEMVRGGCHICGRTEDQRDTRDKKRKHRLAVDHDAMTGKVRGALCGNCNQGIGLFQHDLGLLLKAMEYLDRTKDGFQFTT